MQQLLTMAILVANQLPCETGSIEYINQLLKNKPQMQWTYITSLQVQLESLSILAESKEQHK